MADRRKLSDLKKSRPSRWRKLLMSRGWRVYGAGGCMLLLALVFLVSGVVMSGIWNNGLSKLEADLQAELSLAKTEANLADSGKDEQNGNSQVGDGEGLDARKPRRINDDRIIQDMISHATTWNNRAAYESSRAELLKHYDWLSEETNAEFLLGFFPPGDDLYVRLDGEIVGDLLSDGRNITFGSITTYLLDESEDGVRQYFAEATTQSTGQVGGTATGHMVMTYETRSDGSVRNLKCYSM